MIIKKWIAVPAAAAWVGLLCCLLAFKMGYFQGPVPAQPVEPGIAPPAAAQPPPPSIQQFFSPRDNLETAWVSHIQAARRCIHIACYGLSNTSIAGALKEAVQKRGVEVIIIEDHRQASLPSDLHNDLAASGCHIIVKRSRTLLHDKMGVFDGLAAIVGSYNLSESAEEQDNSDVIFDNDPIQAGKDEAAWEGIFQREVGRSYRPGIDLAPITPQVSGPSNQ